MVYLDKSLVHLTVDLFIYVFIFFASCYPEVETWCLSRRASQWFFLAWPDHVKWGLGTLEEVNTEKLEKRGRSVVCVYVLTLNSKCLYVQSGLKINEKMKYIPLCFMPQCSFHSPQKEDRMVKTSTWCRGILICLRRAFTAIWSS